MKLAALDSENICKFEPTSGTHAPVQHAAASHSVNQWLVNHESYDDIAQLYYNERYLGPALAQANNAIGGMLRAGDKIKLPDRKKLKEINRSLVASYDFKTYTVKTGDSIWSIAKKELGSHTGASAILALNPNIQQDPARIFPGSLLVLPQNKPNSRQLYAGSSLSALSIVGLEIGKFSCSTKPYTFAVPCKDGQGYSVKVTALKIAGSAKLTTAGSASQLLVVKDKTINFSSETEARLGQYFKISEGFDIKWPLGVDKPVEITLFGTVKIGSSELNPTITALDTCEITISKDLEKVKIGNVVISGSIECSMEVKKTLNCNESRPEPIFTFAEKLLWAVMYELGTRSKIRMTLLELVLVGLISL